MFYNNIIVQNYKTTNKTSESDLNEYKIFY